MSRQFASVVSWLAVVVVVATAASFASAGDQPADEDGFVSLFNGKDLDGWDGDPRLWSVVDGAIRGQTTEENPAHGNTFCVWRGGKLKDFVLKIKFRIQNGNSGVQYRSREFDKWRIGGYQAEVENNPGKVGFLYDEAGRGWMVNVGDFMSVERADGNVQKNVVGKVADVAALKEAGYYKMQDWNEYTITARGNHLVHYLNGYPMIEMIDNDPEGRAMEGLLALQIHAGPPMVVEFKDIRLKQLQTRYGEAVRLFDGQSLDGWAFSSDAEKEAWSVKDGALATTGRPVGYIRAESDYTNFVLRMQVRHLKPGNGGVLLRAVGEDKVWPRSLEAQGATGSIGDIFSIDQFPITAPPERTNGRHTRKAHDSNEKPLGQWNEYEIVLDGGELTLVVNGLVQNTATGCWETAGKIGFQAEGVPMEYRNIVLIPIVKQE
ncbi:MAG: DUF1080 domain-containing protein [Pirellulales bacterium]|nr:DUF1080 domain-containing protein [Pirellulales bacterium]